jgi:hypothetical protein
MGSRFDEHIVGLTRPFVLLSCACMAKTPKSSALIDTRVIYCGDNLDQLRKLPDGSVISVGKQSLLAIRSTSPKIRIE